MHAIEHKTNEDTIWRFWLRKNHSLFANFKTISIYENTTQYD